MKAVTLFTELFRGNSLAYGLFIRKDKGGASTNKLEGVSVTKHEQVTATTYQAHIDGTISLGIVPIDTSGNVSFAAIDIDIYPINFKRYCVFFARYNLPLVCFRSKSGGLHAYCFFDKPEPAGKVVEALQVIRQILGLPITTEIFPKQKKLKEGSIGNWINLPYHKADSTERYALDEKGVPLSFDAAMSYCSSQRTTLKSLNNLLSVMPLSQAPPCLQTLYLNDVVTSQNHNRDIFLFNSCVYLKARFKDNFVQHLQQLNEALPNPLSPSEIDKTIIGIHSKTSYTYQCSNPILHSFCNQALCSLRLYGKTNDNITDFDFGQLTQVCTDPPYYKWIINDKPLTFYSETELIKQEIFMEKSIRELGKCPKKLATNAWIEILNKALSDMKKEELKEDGVIFSEKDIVFAILCDFLLTRPLAETITHITLGQVYRDVKNARYVFRLKDFTEYWDNLKRRKVLPINKLHDKLSEIGVQSGKIYDRALKKQYYVCYIEEIKLDKDIDKDAVKETLADQPIPQNISVPAPPSGRGTIAEQLRALAKRAPDELDDATPIIEFKDTEKEGF